MSKAPHHMDSANEPLPQNRPAFSELFPEKDVETLSADFAELGKIFTPEFHGPHLPHISFNFCALSLFRVSFNAFISSGRTAPDGRANRPRVRAVSIIGA